MSRRRSQSWIHRWSRPIIGAIAVLGATNTLYLTATKWFGNETACPTSGCEQVLNSPYAEVFGQPLALFGLLAYLAMAVFALGPLLISPEKQKSLRQDLDNKTWLLLFLGATAMMLFSFYLMFIMVTEFVIPYGAKAVCVYCIASATFATLMFLLTVLGRTWEDSGQLIFTGLIVGLVTLIGAIGIYAPVGQSVEGAYKIESAAGKPFFSFTDQSGEAEIALAKHLNETGAKMYGAYWCPHCYDQKKLFGVEAQADLPYVECAPEGKNPQAELCLDVAQKAEATGTRFGYPTWVINDKFYGGSQSLEDLAIASGYEGPRNFSIQP